MGLTAASLTDPEHPVRWSWTHHAGKRASFEARTADQAHRRVTTVRLRRPAQAREWLRAIPPRAVEPTS